MAGSFTEDQQDAAHWVLSYYGVPNHYPPGGFSGLIIQAYQKADPGNKAKLRASFPELAEAMDIVQRDPEWKQTLAARTK
jgi:hypothetical protein